MSPIRCILVPIDFEPPSKHAMDCAIDLARSLGASVVLLHVYDVPAATYSTAPMTITARIDAAVKADMSKALEDVVATARERIGNVAGLLRRGRAWEQILAAASELGADLIVMGTHGRRGLAHAFLGSVAEKIVRMSRVPVLTIRPGSLAVADRTTRD